MCEDGGIELIFIIHISLIKFIWGVIYAEEEDLKSMWKGHVA